MRDGGGGFTFRQFAFRAVITCLIGRGIDLVQGLACLPIADWYVFRGDWLWSGKGMMDAQMPRIILG